MNHIVNVQMRPVAYGERSERNAGGLQRQKAAEGGSILREP